MLAAQAHLICILFPGRGEEEEKEGWACAGRGFCIAYYVKPEDDKMESQRKMDRPKATCPDLVVKDVCALAVSCLCSRPGTCAFQACAGDGSSPDFAVGERTTFHSQPGLAIWHGGGAEGHSSCYFAMQVSALLISPHLLAHVVPFHSSWGSSVGNCGRKLRA